MHRIAVINQKGGVGKTTTTVNLGAALARAGHRVLLLDMDPQANLTVHLDKRPDLESNTLTNLMIEDAPLKDLVQATAMERLFVVPSDTSLAGVEQVLANRIGRETILREAIDAFPEAGSFDFLLMDCPPSLGVLSANALVAAQHVLVPMQAEYLSLQGMAKLMEVIQLVQRRLNPGLRVASVLPCMVDARTNLSIEVLREIERHFGDLLAKTRIRNNVKLAEAPSFGRTIFEHAPDSKGARDYEQFAAEMLDKLGLPRSQPAGNGTAMVEPPVVREPPTASEPIASEPIASGPIASGPIASGPLPTAAVPAGQEGPAGAPDGSPPAERAAEA
jgi:chromosome partitioning protein